MTEAMARVSIRTDASLNKYTPGSYPAVVKLILQSGECREVEVIFPKGHPNNPMSPPKSRPNFAPVRVGNCRRHARRKSSAERASWKNSARWPS